jgi:hypothetical protein
VCRVRMGVAWDVRMIGGERGEGRQEMGDRRREMGDGRWEI